MAKNSGIAAASKKNVICGLCVSAVCFSALVVVRFGFEENGTYLLLGLIAAIWGSDIGAYMFGKAIGGPKLAPKVSPNKTWAGLVGASFWCGVFLLNMDIVATSLVHVVPNSVAEIFPNYPAVFIVGCVMGVVAQGGDLLVSIFKRKAGVKDTGSIIPGHGGILDRIDALLLASVFYLLALLVVMP